VVLRAHNVEHEIWRKLADESGNNLIKWYLGITASRIENLEKTSLKHYDMLIPITSVDEKFFQDQDGCPPTLVAPFGIELHQYKEKEEEKVKKNTLCFIGALDWRPNQTALLWFLDKVWSPLKKENPSLEFHVAGRNAPANLVENIKKNPVTFHGEVENAVDYMNQHEILIVPLFSGSGIRVKIIEAMALGKVVITTPAGYKGIDCLPGRHLLESRSATDFISRVKSMTRNREKIAEISNNARNLVEEKFDNLAICKKLEKFYKTVVN
jgi:glycosyltransferase involved in cell wall biosynthesis